MPWDFRALDASRKAELLAMYVVEREIEHYYHAEHTRIAENNRDKSGDKPNQPKKQVLRQHFPRKK